MFQVLSAYIARRGSLKGRNVLELGSGTGLVGLVSGELGARVWITDQAFVLHPRDIYNAPTNSQIFLACSPLLDIMNRNTEMNVLSDTITVLELNWS